MFSYFVTRNQYVSTKRGWNLKSWWCHCFGLRWHGDMSSCGKPQQARRPQRNQFPGMGGGTLVPSGRRYPSLRLVYTPVPSRWDTPIPAGMYLSPSWRYPSHSQGVPLSQLWGYPCPGLPFPQLDLWQDWLVPSLAGSIRGLGYQRLGYFLPRKDIGPKSGYLPLPSNDMGPTLGRDLEPEIGVPAPTPSRVLTARHLYADGNEYQSQFSWV